MTGRTQKNTGGFWAAGNDAKFQPISSNSLNVWLSNENIKASESLVHGLLMNIKKKILKNPSKILSAKKIELKNTIHCHY